jgi:hypothetical protein
VLNIEHSGRLQKGEEKTSVSNVKHSSAIFVTFTFTFTVALTYIMTRLFVAVLIIVSLLLACIYILIPKEIKISIQAVVKANEKAVYRSLINESNWKNWWPGKQKEDSEKNLNEFYLNNHVYKAGTNLPFGIEVIISDNGFSRNSLLRLLPLSVDSMAINWTMTQATTSNPFTKVAAYFKTKSIRSDMQQILHRLKLFAEAEKNLYGIDIKQTTVNDTLLMVKKVVQKERPSNDDIYENIKDVRTYISANGAVETNPPMLHINDRNDIKSYEVMVAVPVNKRLTGNAFVVLKRMVAGNILFTEVIGGEAIAGQAMKQMENYVADHQKISPALPYQSLVTDRTRETDTTKWITRIYYPVL